jgi:hypothetical protein
MTASRQRFFRDPFGRFIQSLGLADDRPAFDSDRILE